VAPADYWAGHEYLVEPGTIVRQMFTFGLAAPQWRRAAYYEASSIGRLPQSNAGFDPERWKPRIPNQAFLHARADDKFWAAQRLVALTMPMLRAAVEAGEFGDPDAEAFLVEALAERRDAIGRAYLTAVNPIADPAINEAGELTFRNAAVDADFARAPRGYRAVWSSFDNATRETTAIGETANVTTVVPTPAGLRARDGAIVKVELSAAGTSHASWETPVNAYFRYRHARWQLVGFERMPDAR
jgi:hypothetical protein